MSGQDIICSLEEYIKSKDNEIKSLRELIYNYQTKEKSQDTIYIIDTYCVGTCSSCDNSNSFLYECVNNSCCGCDIGMFCDNHLCEKCWLSANVENKQLKICKSCGIQCELKKPLFDIIREYVECNRCQYYEDVMVKCLQSEKITCKYCFNRFIIESDTKYCDSV